MFRIRNSLVGATISNMLSHWILIGILVLMMSLVFFVQLLISEPFNEDADERENNELRANTYVCSLSPTSKGELNNFISELQGFQSSIDEVFIFNPIAFPLSNEKREEGEINTEALTEGQPMFLISFFPEMSDRRTISCSQGHCELNSGRTEMILADPVYTQVLLLEEVDSQPMSGGLFSLTRNGNEWDCVGVGLISGISQEFNYHYIVVKYENFERFSDFCEGIYIVFSSRPTDKLLDQINELAIRYLPIQESFAPIQIDNTSAVDNASELIARALVVFLLVLNMLSLFDYLLSFRKREFSVYLLTGATMASIWKCAILELAFCGIIAVSIGGFFGSILIGSVIPGARIWSGSLLFFWINVLVFFLIAILGFFLRMTIGRGQKRLSYIEGGSM